MITDTSAAIVEAAEAQDRENARRDAFRRMLNATDRVLWWLEGLNLRDVRGVNKEQRAAIDRELTVLPWSCREALGRSWKVQKMLESVFEIQERLFRWRNPTRIAEGDAGEYGEADLARWSELCRWLESIPSGALSPHMPDEHTETLLDMEMYRLAYQRVDSRWVVPYNWRDRLEQLRARLEGEG